MNPSNLLRASLLMPFVGIALLGASASAQVSDELNAAPLLSGNLSLSFDTNVCLDTGLPSTTSSPILAACGFGLSEDAWVKWTPLYSGPVLVSTCNNATFDTILAVFYGGSLLACNDNGSGCSGGSSELTFNAVAGQTYDINLATWLIGSHGSGTLFVTQAGLAPTPDTCVDSLGVTGATTTTIDTTALTTSGFNGSGFCADPGSNVINQDAFFVWVATEDGDYTFDTFGSNFDTMMSVHFGFDCTANCVGFNDDEPGGSTQSKVDIGQVLEGDVFLIQVGGFGSFSGMATLNISTDPCTSGDDPLEDNDSCATATDLSLSGSNVFEPNLFVSKFDKDHYAFTVAAGATVQIELLFDNSLGDIDAFLREASSPDCGSGNGANELASGFSSDDNESFSWRNTSLTCAEVVLEVNVYDDPSNANCNDYDLFVQNMNLCSIGMQTYRFCDPNNPNSTGLPTTLSSIFGGGTTPLALLAFQGPPNQFGYFVVGQSFNEPGFVLGTGSGQFCLAGIVGRYNFGTSNSLGQFDSAGDLKNLVGTGFGGNGFLVPSQLPLAGSPTIMAGEIWHFQLWHREAAGGANLSNGLSVQF